MNTLKYAGAVALVAVSALGLSACSSGGTTATSSSDGDRASTVIIADPNTTTFADNFSPLSPTQGDANIYWFYEPLIRYTVGGQIEPWLASSQQWDAATSTWNLTLRSGVKWADGSTLTPEDVLYSLNLYLAHPEYGYGFPCDYDSVTANGNVISLHYPNGWSNDNAVSLGLKPIVSKANWQGRDPASDLDPHPDGTGPFTLTKYSQQQITVTARSDYWGGKLPMKSVKLLASSSQAAQSQITSGEADWASIDWPGGKSVVSASKDAQWWQRDAGDGMALFFNLTKAPFNDPAFRTAISEALDRNKLAKITGSDDIAAANEAGLASAVYKDWIKPGYDKTESPDPTGAKKTLADAGYTVSGGKLSKGGTTFKLDLTIDNTSAQTVAIAKGVADQLSSALGLTVTVEEQDSDTFSDTFQSGNFNMAISSEGNSQGAAMAYERVLDPADYKPIGTETSIDQSRWNDPTTASLLQQALTSTDTNVQKQAMDQLEDIVVQQVPFVPLVTQAMSMQISTKYWKGWPSTSDPSYYPYPYGSGLMGTDGVLTLMHLTPAS